MLVVVVVDNAVYVGGHRQAEPESLGDSFQLLRSQCGLAWIGLYRPADDEFMSLATEFRIHAFAVEDTMNAHQRPKLARYDDVLFTVLRPARYVEADERVEFGELHVFTGKDFVVTVRHAESPDLAKVRTRMEADPAVLRMGSEAVLYAILDEVVDGYHPVVIRLEQTIDHIEDQVLDGDPEVSMRIYDLFREVTEFQRATRPLIGILRSLRTGFDKYQVDEELRRSLRVVEERLLHVVDRVDGFWALLQNILTVNGTLVGQRQNEDTRRLTEASLVQNAEIKRISSWAAILFAPTLVAAIYGMNFEHMPERRWEFGYPLALFLMVLSCAGPYLIFKKRGWW